MFMDWRRIDVALREREFGTVCSRFFLRGYVGIIGSKEGVEGVVDVNPAHVIRFPTDSDGMSQQFRFKTFLATSEVLRIKLIFLFCRSIEAVEKGRIGELPCGSNVHFECPLGIHPHILLASQCPEPEFILAAAQTLQD